MDWPSFWGRSRCRWRRCKHRHKGRGDRAPDELRTNVRSTADESVRDVRQQGNRVGGDLAGRDIDKRV